jgi:S-adenosylmethionine hydrolase
MYKPALLLLAMFAQAPDNKLSEVTHAQLKDDKLSAILEACEVQHEVREHTFHAWQIAARTGNSVQDAIALVKVADKVYVECMIRELLPVKLCTKGYFAENNGCEV